MLDELYDIIDALGFLFGGGFRKRAPKGMFRIMNFDSHECDCMLVSDHATMEDAQKEVRRLNKENRRDFLSYVSYVIFNDKGEYISDTQ